MREEDFWGSRDALTKIRQQARARRVSPWAVFGGVIARIVASVEPTAQLPPIVGGFGSINIFIGIVGRSGQGKGASQAAAEALLEIHSTCRFDTVSIGSGEGIAAAYVERRKDDTGEFSVHQHSESALLDVAEIDTLTALAGRQGSTLLAELRKVWSGERLGFQNRDSSRSLPVEAHKYRAALVAGIQPTRAGALLDDASGGTPQRFLWLPATDPHAPSRKPFPPERLKWSAPGEDVLTTGEEKRRTIRVCDTAVDAIDAAHLARLRGDGDALDGHALFSRLKVAAALALLDERGDVNEEDWELAGVVMTVSDATRAECRRQITAAAKAVNQYRAEARAEASVIVADHAEIAALARCKERVLDKLSNDWTSAAPIRKNLSAKLRDYFEQAIEELIGDRIVEAKADKYQGQPRVRYRLLSSAGVAKPPPLDCHPSDPHNHADFQGWSAGVAKLPPLPDDRHPSAVDSEGGTA